MSGRSSIKKQILASGGDNLISFHKYFLLHQSHYYWFIISPLQINQCSSPRKIQNVAKKDCRVNHFYLLISHRVFTLIKLNVFDVPLLLLYTAIETNNYIEPCHLSRCNTNNVFGLSELEHSCGVIYRLYP